MEKMQEMVTITEEFQKKNLLNKSEQMVMQYSKSKQVQKKSLILNPQVIKKVESYKYLWNLKNTKGTSDLCINKRTNCALGVIHEIKFHINPINTGLFGPLYYRGGAQSAPLRKIANIADMRTKLGTMVYSNRIYTIGFFCHFSLHP